MRPRMRLYAALVSVTLTALWLAGCGSQAVPGASPLLCLATDFPTTGPNAALGMSAQRAVDLAVDQAALGGGYALSTLHYNSATTAQGHANMTDAASQECARALIGSADDTVAAAEMPIAINAALPMLAPGLTDPGLTNPKDTRYFGLDFSAMHPDGKQNAFFRLLATDDAQADVAAAAMLRAGSTRVYVVDDGQPYALGVGDYFTAALARNGGSVVGRSSTSAATPAALAPMVAAIAAAKADGIFVAGNTSVTAAVRQALTRPLPFVVMGPPVNDPAYIQAAGASAEGTLAVTASPDIPSLQGAAATQFVAAYTQRYGDAPTPLAASAYDAAEIAIGTIRAIIASGNVPYRISVLNRIASQRSSGIASSYWFSTAGDNVLAGPITVYQVHEGRWEIAERR